MNTNMHEYNPLLFFDRALEIQRRQLLSVMADAVSECRTADDLATELSEDGEIGLFRLAEIWCYISPDEGDQTLEGTGAGLLADVLAQIYASLILCPLHHQTGMALYMELIYMMETLMLGEWFE